MRYQRPLNREPVNKEFSVGTHSATITAVRKKKSSKGNEMFILQLEGKQEEKGAYFLVFGNDYTEPNINYILASIEDNGQMIPDVKFGYNKETYDFLANKEVYIQVVESMYNGQMQKKVETFLTLNEFESSEQEDETEDESW